MFRNFLDENNILSSYTRVILYYIVNSIIH